MKKRLLLVLLTISMLLSVSNTVFATTVETNNLQLMYARLQLALQEQEQQMMEDTITQISKMNDEQRLLAEYVEKAMSLEEEAAGNSEQQSMIDDDMYDYLKENNLLYDDNGDDKWFSVEEWGKQIDILETHMRNLSAETQETMRVLQMHLGQYNSYLGGANEQTNNSNQTLTGLARGQSMYGASDVGLAVTGLVVGFVLGCVITLLLQKTKRKKDKV